MPKPAFMLKPHGGLTIWEENNLTLWYHEDRYGNERKAKLEIQAMLAQGLADTPTAKRLLGGKWQRRRQRPFDG
jgi:hypothetical protein